MASSVFLWTNKVLWGKMSNHVLYCSVGQHVSKSYQIVENCHIGKILLLNINKNYLIFT